MVNCKRNDIINIKEKNNNNTSKLGALAADNFQTLLPFINVNTKNSRGKGTTLLNPDITFNIFRPPFVGLKPGNDRLVEAYHNNPQF